MDSRRRSRRAWTPVLGAVLAIVVLFPSIPLSTSQAQGPAAAWTLTDAKGDVRPMNPAAPPTPAGFDHVDLVGARVARDDGSMLAIAVEVADLAVGEDSGSLTSFGIVHFEVQFRLAGSEVYYIARASLETQLNPGGSPPVALARAFPGLCITAEIPARECFLQPFNVQLDAGTNEVLLEIAKTALLGREAPEGWWFDGLVADAVLGPGTREVDFPPPGIPTTLRRGDLVEDLRVRVQPRSEYPYSGYDSMPDAGAAAPYPLAAPIANTVLILEGDPSAYAESAVGAYVDWTTPSLVPLRVANDADEERVVDLQYRVSDLDLWSLLPGGSERFRVDMSPRATIPAHGVRSLPLVVETTREGVNRGVAIDVTAVDPRHPDEIGFVRVFAIGTAPPSLDNPTLYFHARADPYTNNPAGIDSCLGRCLVDRFNALQEDPDAIPGAATTAYATLSPWDTRREQYVYFEQRVALAGPWAVDGSRPGKAVVRVSSEVPVTGVRVSAALSGWVSGQDAVAAGESRADLTTAGTLIEIPLVFTVPWIDSEDALLPYGFSFHFWEEAPNPAALLTFAQVDGIRVHTADSYAELPLAAPRRYTDRVDPDTPLLAASHIPSGRPVRPGDARLVNLTVYNAGDEPVPASLEVAGPVGWSIEVLPNARLQVPARNGVTWSLLVSPPPGAPSGLQGAFVVQVFAEGSQGAALRHHFGLETLREMDPTDDRLILVEDAAALEAFAPVQPGSTPGLGAVAILGGLVALVLDRRRRHAG